MGSRLKKRKRRAKWRETQAGKVRERGRAVEVTTWAGTFSGRSRGETGWMVLDSYVLRSDVNPAKALHSCGCPETGETYVKPYDGRYRHLSDAQQRARLAELERTFSKLGGQMGPGLRGEPLWLQLEFLENILDFELNPPCGCPAAAASA